MLNAASETGYAKKYSAARPRAVTTFIDNAPCPELKLLVDRSLSLLSDADLIAKANADAVLQPLYVQTANHLQHIRFGFRTENETYPHAPVLAGAYPAAATRKALAKASAFHVTPQGNAA